MSDKEETRRLRELRVIEEARFLVKSCWSLPDLPDPGWFGHNIDQGLAMLNHHLDVMWGGLKKLKTAVEMLDELEEK